MFQQLVSHNDDIRRLVDKGYAVAFDSGYLVVRDVPYLDSERELRIGAIVSKLNFKDEVNVAQTDHQILFSGSDPYGLDGAPIPNLGGGPASLAMSEACGDIAVERSFSNKPMPSGAFADFFDKIESYVAIVSGPAIELHGANPLTFRAVEEGARESVFKFQDTLTSRAEITDLSAKFENDVIAVIGVGGTGAYVLDFLAKTPVQEIRLFDLDEFHVHNAFRSPGALDPEELSKPKAEIYEARYTSFRSGIKGAVKIIDESSEEDLRGVTFAFVCVDQGSSRARIFDLLLEKQIPFIDVGMGLHRRDGALNGLVRITYYSVEQGQTMRDKGFAEMSDSPDDLYKTNIQIAELNALNACLAVIRYKQVRGLYFDECAYEHVLFGVGDLQIAGECGSDAVQA